MDWNDIRTFLTIAQRRTLTNAARKLGVGQSTISRRLMVAVNRYNAQLLIKTPNGYQLTDTGRAILANAERMDLESLAIDRALAALDETCIGDVRLTTTSEFAALLMPSAMLSLRDSHAGITVNVIADNPLISLLRNEAEIDVRMAPFENSEIVARRIGRLNLGLYASSEYLKRHGPLTDDKSGHRIITTLNDLASLPEALWIQRHFAKVEVVMRTNNRYLHAQAVEQGLGIALLSTFHAKGLPDLVQLTASASPPVIPIWLGVHSDLRRSVKTRAVFDAVVDAVKRDELLQ